MYKCIAGASASCITWRLYYTSSERISKGTRKFYFCLPLFKKGRDGREEEQRWVGEEEEKETESGVGEKRSYRRGNRVTFQLTAC